MESSIQKYQAFVKTVDCGGITLAAQAMGVSQSGVSRMIADLEREWGVKLLVRGRSGVRLTDAGREIYPLASRICADHSDIQAKVDALRGRRTGAIRIAAFSSVATYWIPRAVAMLSETSPEMEYEVLEGDYNEISEWILSGRADCGFLRAPVAPGLASEVLARDRLVAVLPEGSPLARRKKVPLKELAKGPFLMLERNGQSDVREVFAEHGLKPAVKYTTWDDYSIMSMAESGLGVSILPALIMERSPFRVAVRELDVPAYRDICFAYRPGMEENTAVKRFRECLEKVLT